MASPSYSPSYASSHALIIGINSYKHASPLNYAAADAKAVATILRKRFDFPATNVKLLFNKAATKSAILKAFYAYASDIMSVDDRLVIFFAGHGHTLGTRRGDVGFLVPYDGDSRDLASLIRWQELTAGADTFEAKHVLFLMDACYGGSLLLVP